LFAPNLGVKKSRWDPKDGMDSAQDVEIESLKLIGLHYGFA
jgi:hypothetical protein